MSKLKTDEYTLFDYLHEQHDLILTESELAEVMHHAKSADLTKADWEIKKLQRQNQELKTTLLEYIAFDEEEVGVPDDIAEKDQYFQTEGWKDSSAESEYHYPIRNVTHWAEIEPPK